MTEILEAGTPVMVELPTMSIRGEIVGRGSISVSQTYIIKCTDGQIPNIAYEYDTFITQGIYIKKIKCD